MISKDKEYRTRDGHEVRIYATGCGGKYPVHGAFLDEKEGWEAQTWTDDGRFMTDIPCPTLDLVEIDHEEAA